MHNKTIEIAGRKIGSSYKPLVIAEIGINHNGSLEEAKKMVDAAFDAGSEVVKHQTHIVSDEMSAAAKNIVPANSDISIFDIMKGCSLSESDELALKNYVESKNMIFLSTPFSRAAADRLEKFGISAYKIGSGEMNNLPLIEHIAKFGKPMIVATGMNDIKAVRATVEVLDRHNVEYALLHTTNLYPTPFSLVRLGAMQELSRAFPDVVFGLSDHTVNNNACLAAMALGASIIERHFTDTKERIGPDIVCSMDKEELRQLVKASEEIFQMRGGEKKAAKEEQVTIDFAFATVVAIADIKKGDRLTKDNIWVKRPGTGEILARDYGRVLGAVALNDITADTHLKWDIIDSNVTKE